MVIFSWYHDLGFENNSGTNCEYLRQSMPVSFAKHCMVLACKQMLPPFVTRWKWQPGMRFKIYWNPVEIQKKMLKSNINQQQCCFIWYCSIFHWQIDLIVVDTFCLWIFIPDIPDIPDIWPSGNPKKKNTKIKLTALLFYLILFNISLTNWFNCVWYGYVNIHFPPPHWIPFATWGEVARLVGACTSRGTTSLP